MKRELEGSGSSKGESKEGKVKKRIWRKGNDRRKREKVEMNGKWKRGKEGRGSKKGEKKEGKVKNENEKNEKWKREKKEVKIKRGVEGKESSKGKL